MAFDEILFPTNISRGSRASIQQRHSLLELPSGAVSSIARWPNALWSFDVGYGIRAHRTFEDIRAITDFYLRRGAQSNGFRFENPKENTTASDGLSAPDDEDEVIGYGDGSTTTFQLVKTYTDALGTTTRTITKPKAATTVVAIDGVAQSVGWTVDTSSGVITFGTPPTGGGSPQVVTAGCRFDLPCMFSPRMNSLDLQIESVAGQAARMPSIQIIEMAGDVTTPQQPYRGGGSEQSFSSDLVYDYAMGAMVVLTPSTSGLSVVLPYITDLDYGGPHFQFINASGSHSIDFLNRATNATEFSLAASTSALVGVVPLVGVKTYKAMKGV